jgi:hypothetical protein
MSWLRLVHQVPDMSVQYGRGESCLVRIGSAEKKDERARGNVIYSVRFDEE